MPSNVSNNNKRIAKNTILLYVRMILIMIVTLYTSRVILQSLGVTDFGIYNVVGGVVAMMGIDYNDFLIYMPLLNMCFAIQFGHWYVISPHETRQPVTMWLMVAMLAAFIIAMVIA